MVEDISESQAAEHLDNKELLAAMLADYTAIRTQLIALGADVTALRTVVANLVTDNANRISDHNTLRTKLNSDGGVTDTDYAAATAATAAAPAALTYAAPTALSVQA